MHPTRFRFDQEWMVAAPVERVTEVLVDLAAYPDWWPQVLAVARLGDDRARLLCRSALPYTLDLVVTAVRRESPLEILVEGDLTGWVTIGLSPTPDGTALEWRQEAYVGGWRALPAAALRSVLTWNHARMTDGLRTGLAARLR